MNYDLPAFDTLREMAQSNPEALEKLRARLCDQLIRSAPEAQRRRLRGLQFQIDMERRKARTPMAACIAISGMMHESFEALRQTLNDAVGQKNQARTFSSDQKTEAPAKILPFQRA